MESTVKKVMIEYDAETGKCLDAYGVRDNGDRVKGSPLDPAQFKEIYERPDGFRFSCLILHYKINPGCIVVIGNTPINIC